MFAHLTFIELLKKGGVTVAILGILSLISIAVIIERAWTFGRFKKGLREFTEALHRAVKEDGLAMAARLCSTHRTTLARVFLAGYGKKGRSKEEILSAMELAGRQELTALERFLGFLGTIGSTAPFIGLFGTVLGIIRAFSDLSAAQGASPAAVADGIAEALVATAAGLFVAVPAVVAYNYYVRSASRCALTLEAAAVPLADYIAEGAKDGVADK
ncbi:MAG: MotA/TolQ/ExbB proton channel family protein [Deltaproteobacteria bacterium]|nr:MotA/TolQ/ExbB proton channel family protein [Deltaproteobacteria bacterium]